MLEDITKVTHYKKSFKGNVRKGRLLKEYFSNSFSDKQKKPISSLRIQIIIGGK